MESLFATLTHTLYGIPAFALAFLIMVVGKIFYDKTSDLNFNEELTEKDNPAFGAVMAGFLIGLGIAMAGVLSCTGDSLISDLLTVAVYGTLIVITMRASVWVNDKYILSNFKIEKEISQDKNMGTGMVVAGSCIATGIILNGALLGDSANFWRGIFDLIVYSVVGQVILVFAAKIFQRFSPYNVQKTIEQEDNIAAGLTFGGFIVASAIITRSALIGATSNILSEIFTTVVIAGVGLVILPFVMVIACKFILPQSSLAQEVAKDKNPAAGAVLASCFVAMALLISCGIAPSTSTTAQEDGQTATVQEAPSVGVSAENK